MQIIILDKELIQPVIDLLSDILTIATKISHYFGNDVEILITLEDLYVSELQIWLEINSKYSVIETLERQAKFDHDWWLDNIKKYPKLRVMTSYYSSNIL
jgi:hypothetical protein